LFQNIAVCQYFLKVFLDIYQIDPILLPETTLKVEDQKMNTALESNGRQTEKKY